MNSKTVTLNTGAKIPVIGLGTFLSTKESVVHAIEVGYKHVDGALYYDNEKQIGEGLQECFKKGVKREDIFVTSKLWNTYHRPELVAEALETSLKDLQLDYVDLYLMHWPFAQKPGTKEFDENIEDTPLLDTWKEIEKLYKAGKAKAIGVSNFNIDTLQEFIDKAEIKPAVNQVELHPYLPQQKLVDFCHANNIQVTAYCPLGINTKPKIFEDPIINEVAKKNNMTPSQVILSWNVQRNVIVIPKSVTPSRIEENFQIKELSKEDFDKINSITIRCRTIDAGIKDKNGNTIKLFPSYNDL
ncbi:Aldo/keto reductase [Anaeromyces robustus]|jgi:diketogulonate reductase-like aldo/keto reductase|uniref:Aldo/keto reductase n=1 Tax=Anaeromyces robustus TaxID=1754192 RepID=A0A1Y1XEC4_9FUNG|nr:Aldo/keto reductase [Anaeromyces robustus]|eukprot:ORX84110.1 Aldo/keto reductase [Anaeromyces robustus]